MRYEEPIIKISVPISILRRIEDSLFREIGLVYDMRKRGHRLGWHNKSLVRETEMGLEIISDALTNYEAEAIIGESLSDAKLKKEFPPTKRNGKRKK